MKPSEDALVGKTLGGYRILAVLGRGAGGTVYQAEDERGVAQALKVPSSPAGTERCRREWFIASKLRSQNIVRVTSFDEHSAPPFLAMEFIDGMSIRQWLDQSTKCSVELATRIAIQVLDALHVAHAEGIVHRDVKPSNILLTRDEEATDIGDVVGELPFHPMVVKLADFGVAADGSEDVDNADSNRIVGSVPYMAPEQITEPGTLDTRSDIYALGCTMIEMVSGQKPYEVSSIEELMARHHAVGLPVAGFAADLPKGFVAALMKMTAIDPEDRFATARHAIEGLLSSSVPETIERDADSAAADNHIAAGASNRIVQRNSGQHDPPTEPLPIGRRDSDITIDGLGSAPRMINRFELRHQLVADAFTETYSAFDTKLQLEVAVAVPRHGSIDGPEEARRFLAGARASAGINHPNVTATHDFGDSDGELYCVYHDLPKRLLADFLTSKRLSWNELLDIAAQLLAGVSAVHRAGVVHRHIKPSNISIHELATDNNYAVDPRVLFGKFEIPRWCVKIRDFHLGRVMDDMTLTIDGMMLGTPAYMSPEMARGEAHRVDGRADLYAVGVIMYEMACGERPFRGNMRMLIHQIANDEAPELSALRADVPPKLNTFIMKLLMKNPDDRYPNATAALEALMELRSPTSMFQRTASWLLGTVLGNNAIHRRSQGNKVIEVKTRLGPYQLLKELASVEQVSAWEAYDDNLNTQAFITVYDGRRRGSRVDDFQKRAQRLAHIGSPHVVAPTSFAMDQDDNRIVYYAQTYGKKDETLAQVMVERGALPALKALDICEQLLLGIEALQKKGILHGTVQPSLIVLQEDDEESPAGKVGREQDSKPRRVRLADVSLSTVTRQLIRKAQTTGTFHVGYLAPEAFRESDLDHRADYYSVGCVLFEMLCGVPPFSGSAAAIARGHESGDASFPDPVGIGHGIPAKLRDFLLELTKKDPSERFQTADDAIVQLRSVRNSLRALPTREPVDEAFSSHSVVTTFPSPIAIAYQRFCAQDRDAVRSRLDMLFSAFESTLRYLLALALCELIQYRTNANDDQLPLPDHQAFDCLRRSKPMQLGMWHAALRESARALKDLPGLVVSELPDVCQPGGEFDTKAGRIIQLRNEKAHPEGGIAATDEECREMLREARPCLEDLLERIRFVQRYPLGYAEQFASASPKPVKQHSYSLRSCMGANPTQPYDITTEVQIEAEIPFIASHDERRLCYLWPMLTVHRPELGPQLKLFSFVRISERSRGFLQRIEYAALDSREVCRGVCDEPTARLRSLHDASTIPMELEIGAKLMPARGGDLSNHTLGGKYFLKMPVGSGGFGTIYLADRLVDHAQVAVKVLESRELAEYFSDRFENEFKKLYQAREHRGIIKCYEKDEDVINGQRYHWYSMEFADGGDLGIRIRQRADNCQPEIPWNNLDARQQIIREFSSMVEAVSHLHQMGIVHRDIKPSNVLITDGTLRLSDFGLVKNLAPSEQSMHSSSGAVVGTRHYMAPEQEQGLHVEAMADVYALGVLLTELAIGRRPTPNTRISSGSTMQQWLKDQMLPKPLRNFVFRCTDVSPEKRYPDADAAGKAFATLVANEKGADPASLNN